MAPQAAGTRGPATHRINEELTVGVAEHDGISVPREAGQATGPGDVPDGLARRLEALERASIESGDARKLMEDAQADLRIEICTGPTCLGIDRCSFRADRSGVYIGCGRCAYPHDQVRRLRDFLNDLYGKPEARTGGANRLTKSQAEALASELATRANRAACKAIGGFGGIGDEITRGLFIREAIVDALDHVGVVDPDPANAVGFEIGGPMAAPLGDRPKTGAIYEGNSLRNRPVNAEARAARAGETKIAEAVERIDAL